MGPGTLLLLAGALLGLCCGERPLAGEGVALAGGGALGGWRLPVARELLAEAEEGLWAPGWEWLGDLLGLEPECRELLAAFANSSVKLTGCLARSARPVRLCQNCYRQFRELNEQLENISRAVGVRPTVNARPSLQGPGWGRAGLGWAGPDTRLSPRLAWLACEQQESSGCWASEASGCLVCAKALLV